MSRSQYYRNLNCLGAIFTSPRALKMHESPNRASAAFDVVVEMARSESPKTAAAAASRVAADLEKEAEANLDILGLDIDGCGTAAAG